MHESGALRADRPEVAAGGGYREILDHQTGRYARLAAFDAVAFVGLALATCPRLALVKGDQVSAQDQGRLLVADRRQAILDPPPNRDLGHAKRA